MFDSLQPGSTDYSRGGRLIVWRGSGGVARTSAWLQPANRVCEPNIELSSAELFSVGQGSSCHHFGLERFRLYLYSPQFTIQSDHKPLQHILGPRSAVPTLAAQRLQRWVIILSAFRYELQYIPGERNTVADALSRFPLPATSHRDVDAIHNICSL